MAETNLRLSFIEDQVINCLTHDTEQNPKQQLNLFLSKAESPFDYSADGKGIFSVDIDKEEYYDFFLRKDQLKRLRRAHVALHAAKLADADDLKWEKPIAIAAYCFWIAEYIYTLSGAYQPIPSCLNEAMGFYISFFYYFRLANSDYQKRWEKQFNRAIDLYVRLIWLLAKKTPPRNMNPYRSIACLLDNLDDVEIFSSLSEHLGAISISAPEVFHQLWDYILEYLKDYDLSAFDEKSSSISKLEKAVKKSAIDYQKSFVNYFPEESKSHWIYKVINLLPALPFGANLINGLQKAVIESEKSLIKEYSELHGNQAIEKGMRLEAIKRLFERGRKDSVAKEEAGKEINQYFEEYLGSRDLNDIKDILIRKDWNDIKREDILLAIKEDFEALKLFSQIMMSQGELDNSLLGISVRIKVLEDITKMQQKTPFDLYELLSFLYGEQGRIYQKKTPPDYKRAAKAFETALESLISGAEISFIVILKKKKISSEEFIKERFLKKIVWLSLNLAKCYRNLNDKKRTRQFAQLSSTYAKLTNQKSNLFEAERQLAWANNVVFNVDLLRDIDLNDSLQLYMAGIATRESGLNFLHNGQIGQALPWLMESKELLKQSLNIEPRLSRKAYQMTVLSLAELEIVLGNNDLAKSYLNNAEELMTSKTSTFIEIILKRHRADMEKNDLKALQLYKQSVRLCFKDKDRLGLYKNFLSFIKRCLKNNKVQIAEEFMEMAKEIYPNRWWRADFQDAKVSILIKKNKSKKILKIPSKHIKKVDYQNLLFAAKQLIKKRNIKGANQLAKIAFENIETLRINRPVLQDKVSLLDPLRETAEIIVPYLIKKHKIDYALGYIEALQTSYLNDMDLTTLKPVAEDEYSDSKMKENELYELMEEFSEKDLTENSSNTQEFLQAYNLWSYHLYNQMRRISKLDYHREAKKMKISFGEDTLAVNYFFTEDNGFAFLVFANKLKCIRIKTSRPEIENLFEQMQTSLKNKTLIDSGENKPLSSLGLLYERLIKPFEKLLFSKKISRVLIIPDSSISWVPFCALWRKLPRGKFKYLIDGDFTISYAANFRMASSINSKKIPTDILVIANPETNLDYTEKEANLVVKSWQRFCTEKEQKSSPVIFRREEATLEKFLEEAPKSGIIHLAMHAEANARFPLLSNLTFAKRMLYRGRWIESNKPYKLSMSDLLLFRKLNLKAQSVFINACSGASPLFISGNEIISLSLAFLQLGSESVVSNLWPIEDVAGQHILAKEFYYRYLVKNDSKDIALKLAQKSLKTKFPDPYHWAPQVLYGQN